jgi:Flp pilus assembly protein TadG
VHKNRSRSRGQSLVEAAITLPLVLILALGVIDIGRAFYYREAVTNSVRQALRMAVSSYQQTTANTACASTSGGPVTKVVSSALPPPGGSSILTIANQAALESTKDGTAAGSVLSGATLTVSFHCLSGVAITNASGNGNGPSDAGSDSITAAITYNQAVVTPLLWPIIGTTFPITISASQRVEY